MALTSSYRRENLMSLSISSSGQVIVLDTNVVAELMRPAPSPEVVAWLNGQQASQLYLTSITLGEISFGIEILPLGKRRLRLERGFRLVRTAFTGRILDFDDEAAILYGRVMGRRRSLGRPLGVLDGQIAAIASAHGATVATRNVRDFEDCGLEIINPFPPPETDPA